MITVKLINALGETTVYDSRRDEQALSKLTTADKLNTAGSAEIAFPAGHFNASSLDSLIVPFRTVVEIMLTDDTFRGETLLFRGRALLPSRDFFRTLTVHCEGEYNFLCDSVVDAGTLTGTPSALLSSLITAHNSQVDVFKRFTVGTVSVSPSVDPSVELKEATSTAAALTKLIEQVGGVIRFDTVNGSRTISWLASDGANPQQIHYGANLLDLKAEYANTELCTRVIPYGKATDGVRLQLPSPGYVEDADAQTIYGIIAKAVVFNECETVADLTAKATEYLNEHKSPVSSLTVNAVDLSATGQPWDDSTVVDTTPWVVGKTITIKSAPHGINGAWLLTERTHDLLNPSNDRITLGTPPTPISSIVNQ
jgi:phage minor structural protein, N-terminal region